MKTSKSRLFLDIHAIQTLPPSNINRDDTGTPKTAQYGGVRRARVSSQSWKRAMREYFYDNSEQANIGIRSLEVVKYIANKIMDMDNTISEDDAMEMSNQVLKKAGVKTKDNKARALFFISDRQADELAKAAIEGEDDKKQLQALLREDPSIDIALFGRMVADDPSLNEDASSQVAHAISTHGVQTEFDFFTAVDDLAPEDNAGAGMLGTIEFNSSTLYRYANVAVHELLNQLEDKEMTINTLKLFIEAFSNSLPSGKSNTFANQTLPQALVLTVRNDRPVNLVSAFENPIKSGDGYVKESIDKLFNEQNKVEKFVNEPIFTIYISTEDVDQDDYKGSELPNLNKLLDSFEEKIGEAIEIELGE